MASNCSSNGVPHTAKIQYLGDYDWSVPTVLIDSTSRCGEPLLKHSFKEKTWKDLITELLPALLSTADGYCLDKVFVDPDADDNSSEEGVGNSYTHTPVMSKSFQLLLTDTENGDSTYVNARIGFQFDVLCGVHAAKAGSPGEKDWTKVGPLVEAKPLIIQPKTSMAVWLDERKWSKIPWYARDTCVADLAEADVDLAAKFTDVDGDDLIVSDGQSSAWTIDGQCKLLLEVGDK